MGQEVRGAGGQRRSAPGLSVQDGTSSTVFEAWVPPRLRFGGTDSSIHIYVYPGGILRILALAVMATLVAGTAMAQDADRSVADGGIKVAGWKGRVDRRPLSQGKTIADSRLAAEGSNLRLSVGPKQRPVPAIGEMRNFLARSAPLPRLKCEYIYMP